MLKDYVAVDLEMTGLNPKKDRILEIGAVKVKDKQIVETFSKLICPECVLDSKIIEITGITNEQAALGEETDSAVSSFLEFAEDLTWIGHNIIFDYCFIKQWEVNHRVKKTCFAADTLKIARICLKEMEKKTLDYLCDYYAIAREKRHRAYHDAAATQILYEILEARFSDRKPQLFEPKELRYNVKRQTPATMRQKNYLMDLVKYHNITLDVSMEQLSRSEASRLTDQIIRQYGKR